MSTTIRRCLLTATIMMTAAQTLAAQAYATGRGSMLIDGSASFTSSQSGDDDRITAFGVQPSVQYFVRRGLALGGEVSFGHSSVSDRSATTYGIGPVISYYFEGNNNRLYPFLSLGAGYTRTAFNGPLDDTHISGTSVRGAGGLLFMLSSSVGINSELFYQRLSQSDGFDSLDSNSFGLAFGIAAFLF